MDHAQEAVLDAARLFLRRSSERPVIVVQTTLHEGYLSPDSAHGQPYPFGDAPSLEDVPPELARSLAAQRAVFTQLHPTIRFVPVDFTLADDGYEPVFYGVDALWTALEEALPAWMLAAARAAGDLGRALGGTYARAAHPHVIPVPLIDLPLTTLVQAKMFQSIASIYSRRLSREVLAEFGSTLGVGLLTRIGQRQLLKLVPIYGPAASALLTGATTYALGMTLCAYYDRLHAGGAVDSELLRELYAERFEQGKQLLRNTVARLGKSESRS